MDERLLTTQEAVPRQAPSGEGRAGPLGKPLTNQQAATRRGIAKHTLGVRRMRGEGRQSRKLGGRLVHYAQAGLELHVGGAAMTRTDPLGANKRGLLRALWPSEGRSLSSIR